MRVHSFDADFEDFAGGSGGGNGRRGRDGGGGERRRRRFDDEADVADVRVRRGRLTDLERERLAAARADADDTAALPDDADRWSTWGQGEVGPEPYPSWVITEEGAVDTWRGVVKTGKEAEVHLVERALPGTSRRVLLAAKQYRSAEHRLFHRDAGYLEGRRVKESRMVRAIANRTEFGRKLIAEQWAAAEFTALCRLWTAGAPVPYPVERMGTDLLLEFIGDADGGAAPRLAQVRPSGASGGGGGELVGLWEQLVDGLASLARAGFTHGDLSAYNVLVHEGRLVLIDLPQVVDVVVNPRGAELMERDVRNISGWFAARGLADVDRRSEELLEMLRAEAGLGAYKGI